MRALIPLLVGLLLPASASAAQLGQGTPLDLGGDEWCLRATGMPGELVVPATDGMRVVAATRDGLVAGRTLKLGKGFDCGSAVGHANGAAVIAGSTQDGAVVAV